MYVDSCKENRSVVQTDATPLSVRRDAEMLGRHRHVLAMSCVINLTPSYNCLANSQWWWLKSVSNQQALNKVNASIHACMHAHYDHAQTK